jgi:hypothetical protein
LTDDDYTRGPFYADPYGKYPWDEICDDCLKTIAEVNEAFEEEKEDA